MSGSELGPPLVSRGALTPLLTALFDADSAPLQLLASAACQVGQVGAASSLILLTAQFVCAARELGLRADLLSARVDVFREDHGRVVASVGARVDRRSDANMPLDAHLVVRMETFAALVDVTLFMHPSVREGVIGLDAAFTNPPIVAIGNPDLISDPRVVLAVRREPLHLRWEVDPGPAVPLEAVLGDHADLVADGGALLAGAVIDILRARSCVAEPGPILARHPQLASMLASPENRFETAQDGLG